MMASGLVALVAIASPMPWLAVPAHTVVTVQGTSDCPTPAEVAAVLSGVLPPMARDADAAPEIVSIDPAGPHLMITVRDQDGTLRLTRRLARSGELAGTCANLAVAAAVVIATWRMERSADLSLLQPGVVPPPETWPPSVSAETLPDVPVPVPVRAAPPVALLMHLRAGVGLALDDANAAGTAEVEIAARPSNFRFGLGVALAADMARDQPFQGGTATWRRLSAGAGPYVSLLETPVAVEVRALLLLGRTSVEGQGYETDRSDHAISVGIDGAIRVSKAGRLGPFLEVGARAWLASQDIIVLRGDQTQARLALPQVEGRLTGGLQVSFGT